MNMLNYILLGCGLLTLVIGILGCINQNFTRFISFPGGPRLKAMVATITGIILLVIGLIVNIPLE